MKFVEYRHLFLKCFLLFCVLFRLVRLLAGPQTLIE